jgi:putative sigma-54 modulation protein
MQINISGKQVKVDDNLRGYIEERLRKFEKMVLEPAIVDVVLSNLRGSKGGVDKAIHVTVTLPDIKNPIHLEETTDDYKGSIDLIEERLETQIMKYKEEVKIGTRYPKKYHDAKMQEESEGEL